MSATEPIALAQVEQKILEISDLLEQSTHAQKKRWETAAAADTSFDVAFAKAFLLAKEGAHEGQVKADSDLTAKQRATVLCEKELTAKNVAHALLESAREAARNYRAALDGLRSINSNVRELTVAR